MGVFLAECFWTGVSKADLAALDARARKSRSVRYLGSLFVPDDEVVLCLFGADSAESVQAACAATQIPYERVLEVVEIGSGTLRSCQSWGRLDASPS